MCYGPRHHARSTEHGDEGHNRLLVGKQDGVLLDGGLGRRDGIVKMDR